MSRITTNIPAVVSQRHLAVAQRDLAVALERLSSGVRINRGADDPAGLIVSERLRAEIEGVTQAIDNSQRAINVIATTEGALNEVSALLIDVQALIVEAANRGAFSEEEIQANQLQLNSAIESITRIANTTTFAGRKLLDGSLDYVLSGVVNSALSDVQVFSAKFGTRDFIPVEVDVTQSALQAQLTFTGAGLPAASAGGTVTLDIQGKEGVVTLQFPGSASVPDMVNSINQVSDATGVVANSAAGGFIIQSEGYGSDEFVSVRTLPGSGAFVVTDRAGAPDDRTEGRDAVGTINGGATVGDGLTLSLNSFLLDIQVTLDDGFGVGTENFSITSGGSLFQLGPRVNTNQQENIAVRAMQANRLGNQLVGFLSELAEGQRLALRTGNFQQASDVINEAITQVASLRGRLGAFERNTLQTNISQLQITSENLTASESVIRDTNFAQETTELTRAQILVQAGNSILAIANAQQQNVLTLLGG